MPNARFVCAAATALPAFLFVMTQPAHAACQLIHSAADLQAMQLNLAGNYCLAHNIDLASIPNFVPIGTTATPFTGKFSGRAHAIRNLTIDSHAASVGLFGYTEGARIENVRIINANVTAHGDLVPTPNVGILVGDANGTADTAGDISLVKTSGKVLCTDGCGAGGLIGRLEDTVLSQSSSAADVVSESTSGGGDNLGGAVGIVTGTGVVEHTYATGTVTCGDNCFAGGLAGEKAGIVRLSFATGPVSSGANGRAGGLVGNDEAQRTEHSYATGSVHVGSFGSAGGLSGTNQSIVDQCYAIGPVSSGGGFTGGLFASTGLNVTNSAWDTETSGQATTASGLGSAKTTRQLRSVAPAGFDGAWGISRGVSFPFLADGVMDFVSPLATLVRNNKVYTFLPIRQFEQSNYNGPVVNAERASLATVYTMIARAIGITDDVAQLKNVKTDQYFWDDATNTATFSGPVTAHATLGPVTRIAPGHPIHGQVAARMHGENLVILRGRFERDSGARARHWMLGTRYTKNPDGSLALVIANDPRTGLQVQIDPTTKTVVSSNGFPLDNFRIDGYQMVTILP